VVLDDERDVTSVATSEASTAGLAAFVASTLIYNQSYLVEPLELDEIVTVAVVVFLTRNPWLFWLDGVALTQAIPALTATVIFGEPCALTAKPPVIGATPAVFVKLPTIPGVTKSVAIAFAFSDVSVWELVPAVSKDV
jgi:hypothetical protein